jgi:hypothetical protein
MAKEEINATYKKYCSSSNNVISTILKEITGTPFSLYE